MTIEEASRRYQIPMYILREYESWGLCGAGKKVMGAWRYEDADLERLSTVMTLHSLGFSMEEVARYMRLLEETHTEGQRLEMLEEKRSAALAEIHLRERQLLRLDALRHQLRKKRGRAGDRGKEENHGT